MDLSTTDWILSGLAALLVGFSKTGVTGLGILIVPLMAGIFPAKASVGILLPMLVVGDVFAVFYYRRHAQWGLLIRLLPWVMPGIAAGYFTLKYLSSEQLAPLLGVMVLGLIILNALRRSGEADEEGQPKRDARLAAVMGILSGFATMIGNVAGPIMSVFLFSMGLKKREFMGTGAWYYLIVNCIKIPLGMSLGLIHARSLTFNLKLAPIIALGAIVGIVVFRWIPQVWFRRIILALATLAAFRLALSPWLAG